jgi:hypothetical protein
MEKQTKQTLSSILALCEEEIEAGLIKDHSVKILLLVQEHLARANEEEIGDFISFMVKLDYASSLSLQSGRLGDVNIPVYMALVDTAKARITLLTYHRALQHKNMGEAFGLIAL